MLVVDRKRSLGSLGHLSSKMCRGQPGLISSNAGLAGTSVPARAWEAIANHTANDFAGQVSLLDENYWNNGVKGWQEVILLKCPYGLLCLVKHQTLRYGC
jgi:hypothetical protein